MAGFFEGLNINWVVVVISCMVAHLYGMCVFGFCSDPTMMAFEPTFASAVYTFAISWLIAEYPLYPQSLKKPPAIIVCFFEVMMALMVTNILLMFIWIPVLRMLANLLTMDTNSLIGRLLCLSSIGEYVEPETLLEILATILALILLLAVVYITETPQLLMGYFQGSPSPEPEVGDDPPCSRRSKPRKIVKKCSEGDLVMPEPPIGEE